MAIRLNNESVISEWSTMILNAAGHEEKLLEGVVGRITFAEMPKVYFNYSEVETGGIFAKMKRRFLICENEGFRDFRFFIGAFPYGKHLNACYYLGCSPGILKGMFAESRTGSEKGFSMPTNILAQQELSAWQSVVHSCVLGAVDEVVGITDGDPAKIKRESRGFLQLW